QEFEVSVRPRVPLPIGLINSRMTIVGQLEDGSEVAGIAVRILGEVRPDIQVSPEGGVSFGAKNLGSTASESVSVWSITGKPIEVVSVRPESPSMRVSPTTARSEQRGASYRIEDRLTSEGPQQLSLRIVVRSGGQLHKLDIPVRYYGIAH